MELWTLPPRKALLRCAQLRTSESARCIVALGSPQKLWLANSGRPRPGSWPVLTKSPRRYDEGGRLSSM